MATKFTKLPKLMLDTMDAMQRISNVPEEMSIQAVLGVANFATHAHYDIDPVYFVGNIIPSSMYFLALAPTAGAKSTIYKTLSAGIAKFEEEERIRLQDSEVEYNIAFAMYEKEYKNALKDLSDLDKKNPQVIKKLAKDLKEPPKPNRCNYRIGTATVNGMIDTLARQPYAGMFSSEAGDFFNSHAFQDGKNSSKGLQMLTTLTNLWDGHAIERNTGMDSTKIYNRRFNMLFLLQAAMAKDWLSNPMFSDQGFVHRLLITQAGEWDMPDLETDPKKLMKLQFAQNELQPFHDRVYKLLKTPLNIKEDTTTEIQPTIMQIDKKEALVIMADYANKIKRLRSTVYKDWDGFTARCFEHTCRLAATLAAFEEKTFIDKEAAEGAVELMEFYLEQRLAIELGATSKNQNQITVANKIIEWIKKQPNSEVAHSKLTKFGPGSYRGLTVEEREGVMREVLSRENCLIEERTAINSRGVTCSTTYYVIQ